MTEENFSISEAGPEKKVSPGEHLEIKELESRLKKIETRLGREGAPEEKEKMVKQEIKSYLQGLQQTPSFAPSLASRDEVEEIEKFEPDQQIGALVSLVFEKGKGLLKAISIAKALDNPAILDEFHDMLIDHYYQVLIEKEILKF